MWCHITLNLETTLFRHFLLSDFHENVTSWNLNFLRIKKKIPPSLTLKILHLWSYFYKNWYAYLYMRHHNTEVNKNFINGGSPDPPPTLKTGQLFIYSAILVLVSVIRRLWNNPCKEDCSEMPCSLLYVGVHYRCPAFFFGMFYLTHSCRPVRFRYQVPTFAVRETDVSRQKWGNLGCPP